MTPLLAVPTRGAVRWETITRLEEIRDGAPGMPPILYQPGNLSVAMTRNRIVSRFLATSCDVLVMVDDDVVPPPHLLDVVADPDGACYAMVTIPHPMPHPLAPGRVVLTAYETAGEGLAFLDLERGWNDVDAAATGCCAVRRDALERLGPNPFRIGNDPDAPVTSDDFLFCADLRAAGLRIGSWHDGWHSDHVTTVSLAPIMETQHSPQRST